MKLTWEKGPIRWTATDENGNKYQESCNLETCQATTPDGRIGHGWGPEEALRNAESGRNYVSPWSWTTNPKRQGTESKVK